MCCCWYTLAQLPKLLLIIVSFFFSFKTVDKFYSLCTTEKYFFHMYHIPFNMFYTIGDDKKVLKHGKNLC